MLWRLSPSIIVFWKYSCVRRQRFSLWSWSLKRKSVKNSNGDALKYLYGLEGEGADVSKVNLNLEIARDYFNVLNRLKDEFDLQSPISLKTLAGFRDIFTPPAETAD